MLRYNCEDTISIAATNITPNPAVVAIAADKLRRYRDQINCQKLTRRQRHPIKHSLKIILSSSEKNIRNYWLVMTVWTTG